MRRALCIAALPLALMLMTGCQGPREISSKPTAAPTAERKLAAMEWVTGLHTHFIDGTGFEFRLLEMDGSSSVAMNPIYLYLVVTNNSSGGDEQTRMVSLPKASQIKKVRFYGSEPRIEIDVMLDHMDADGMITTQRPATFEVTASIKGGKLSGDIEVRIRKAETAKP